MPKKKEERKIEEIVVKGARTHNLKNIDLRIPRNKMIVFTGLSGSGKSSLAFDTIFAEGQRRYVESLSAYARQFLKQLQKPDVDDITGLSPAISIDQKTRSNNPRSTVATITEIHDYLRVLFSRCGHPKCIKCGYALEKNSYEDIVKNIIKKVKSRQFHKENTKIAGVPFNTRKITISAPVVIGRKGEYHQLLYDFLSRGYDRVRVDKKIMSLRERIILEKNERHTIDVIVDEFFASEFSAISKDTKERLSESVERALSETSGIVRILYPDNTEELVSSTFVCPNDGFSFPTIEPRLFSFNSPYGACAQCNGLGVEDMWFDDICKSCSGARLREEALSVFIQGKNKKDISIFDVESMTIDECYAFFKNIQLSKREQEIAEGVVKEIMGRLEFMIDVGLDYLNLNRKARTLSGGEAQRIRLASQLGVRLVGALYVLDEPTIGLHQSDNDRLIKALKNLKERGNTIIIVEHDEDTIYSSDYIVDIGVGAGEYGGNIVVSDYLENLLSKKKSPKDSITLPYIRKEKSIPYPRVRRKGSRKISIKGADIYTLKNLSVDIPIGIFNCITGVSGSGKSTLLYEVIEKNLEQNIVSRKRTNKLINVEDFKGSENIGRMVTIDQSPIGRTPRSIPVTYIGAFTYIRDLFANTKDARKRGWGPGRFSFNSNAGGRCPHCTGNGVVAVEMHFLPTIYVMCDVCRGKRFTKEVLDIKYRGKNIYDVLSMSIDRAHKFFSDIPNIEERLSALLDVGLGYLSVGQSATTLSGGEAQRVKIASELYRKYTTKTIYLLDEPTVGLHYEDVKRLIDILHKLVDKGNTVIVIEHNLDVIKNADYVVDMGPLGGSKGGKVVAKGAPENLSSFSQSLTGKYLKKVLK